MKDSSNWEDRTIRSLNTIVLWIAALTTTNVSDDFFVRRSIDGLQKIIEEVKGPQVPGTSVIDRRHHGESSLANGLLRDLVVDVTARVAERVFSVSDFHSVLRVPIVSGDPALQLKGLSSWLAHYGTGELMHSVFGKKKCDLCSHHAMETLPGYGPIEVVGHRASDHCGPNNPGLSEMRDDVLLRIVLNQQEGVLDLRPLILEEEE
jgi:hypothetical protein